jgi:hypothetical protein
MKGPWVQVAAVLLLALLSGCPSVAGPCWLHPGPARVQQTRALQYDPYPQNDEPNSAMAGVRPREYEVPPPEPSRARWTDGKWGQ